jgi:hypothetical protein
MPQVSSREKSIESLRYIITLSLLTLGALFSCAPLSLAQPNNGPSCLSLDASPQEQLTRALADVGYVDCLNTLGKQQAGGCAAPAASAASQQAFMDCLRRANCDLTCGFRAQAFWTLALVTRAYHQVKQVCANQQTPQACNDAVIRQREMTSIAAQLAGGGGPTPF